MAEGGKSRMETKVKNNNDKYTVSIEYDNDRLVKIIRAKIQEQN